MTACLPPVLPREYSPPRSLRELNKELLHDIEEFFVGDHRLLGSEYKVLGVLSAKAVEKIVRESPKV